MTRADQAFPLLVLASLAAHAAVMALLALAPGGSAPRSRVQVYSVQIVEAPAAPEARVLELEAPVNRTALESPTPPAAPRDVKMAPPALPSGPAKSPALPAPKPPKAEGDTQVSLKAPAASLPAPPPQSAASALPEPPAAAPPRATRSPRPAPAAPGRETAPAEAPAGPARPMEQLKQRVEQIHLQVESVPRPDSGEEDQNSVFALRLFHSAVRERVQKNYSFPGTFAPSLKARVRVVVSRDGTQRAADLVQSSGDARFDTLVCLAAIRHSKLPPVPEAVQGDTVTLTLTCSP